MEIHDHLAYENSKATADRTSKYFFDPSSKIWAVHREMVLLLAGGRALLMQLAHPKVAAGVAAHSRFQEDPLGRLYRTMSRMWSIVFDEEFQAREALRQVAMVHQRVRGHVPPDEASHAGAAYNASDQELLLWVHATLIDSAMVAYNLFVAPLNPAERADYYSDSKKLAALFGILENNIPSSVAAFDSYMTQILSSGEIFPGPIAKTLALDVLYPGPWILRPAGPLFRLVTAGLLPATLRDGYGFEWSGRREKRLLLAAKVIRALLPVTPSLVRIVPNARKSERVS
jgi:uncharacterized protein (DUF2236 family)